MTALRPGQDADADGFIRLIAACWAEYPGCVVDIDGEVPELHALASYCAQRGGAVWAAVDGEVQGMICTYPLADGAWEVGKLYLAPALRGGGTAHALLDAAEAFARGHGAARMKLWTDTRFDRAHRFYEKRGYLRYGPLRALNDKSNSIEFAYAKPLTGVAVERLDTAGAASAGPALARILVACVEAGAAVSFLPPLPLRAAFGFWRGVATAVATGGKILLVAWLDGELVGTAQVDLATPPNQPHRADVAKMMVTPAARRHGIARLLLQRAETAAAAAGRSLLTLDTRAGDAGEALYRASGWTECGRIPDYARNADGTLHDTVLFYKRVA